jgi:ribosomal protein S12 methylthiotransferase
VGFISLGCPKNLVDSEVMMGLLDHAGARLTNHPEDAEILVVNTCSFIDTAKQESVDTILEMARHKTSGRARKLIVAGCLVERYRDEIMKSIPEVDAVVGTGELESILEAAGLARPAAASISPFNILTTTQAAVMHPGKESQAGTHKHGHAESARTKGTGFSPYIAPTKEGGALAPASVKGTGFSPYIDPAKEEGALAPASVKGTGFSPYIDPAKEEGALAPASVKGTGFSPYIDPAKEEGALAPASVKGTGFSPYIDPAKEEGALAPEVNSRPEGDLRESQGRFKRDDWQGATHLLPTYLYDESTPRFLTTPKSSAYIKIAEGCDHPCTFCVIPNLRGKFRSRRFESVVAEARILVARGVQEITLIGQDTTCYGEDLGIKDGLATLLDALAKIEGVRWLRFLYAYPNRITGKLLDTIAKHDNICKYLDVPLQHASPSVLKTMKRGAGADIFLRTLDKVRAAVPGIALRTSFIVGFPGESQEDIAILEDFVKEAKFDWLGVFSYSDEEGSGAFSLDAKIPKRTIESRKRRLMKLQQSISKQAKQQWVGRELVVLAEGESEETPLLWEGRTQFHAPEIDGKVYINDFAELGPDVTELQPGRFYKAEITEAHEYDVVARILSGPL